MDEQTHTEVRQTFSDHFLSYVLNLDSLDSLGLLVAHLSDYQLAVLNTLAQVREASEAGTGTIEGFRWADDWVRPDIQKKQMHRSQTSCEFMLEGKFLRPQPRAITRKQMDEPPRASRSVDEL